MDQHCTQFINTLLVWKDIQSKWSEIPEKDQNSVLAGSEINSTLFSFQERAHLKLLRKTDKSVELFLVACLSGEDNTVK